MKFLVAFLFLLAVSASPAQAQLSGTYTVGGTTPDYINISVAVADLNSMGISGPVVFNIRAGTYNEQVSISGFARTGAADDRVTFQRANPNIVVNWRYSSAGSGSNWVIKLDGTSYISFRGLSFTAASAAPYGRMITFLGGSGNITVVNCDFEGLFADSNFQSSIIHREGFGDHPNNVFRSNTFTYGYAGINWPDSGNNSIQVMARGNTFTGQTKYGLRLDEVEQAIVDSNYVVSAAWSDTGFIGIRLSSTIGGFAVQTAQISNNLIQMPIGSVGISLSGLVDESSSLINNFVAVYDPANGNSGISVFDCQNLSIYHNTVRTSAPSAEAFHITDPSENLDVRNNIFSADGGGYAIEYEEIAGISADFNNLYTTGSNIARVSSVNYTSLSNYQDAVPLDLYSTDVAVSFVQTVGANDLHLIGASLDDPNLLARSLGSVSLDFDDDPRSAYSVFKGADEGNEILPLDDDDTGLGFYTVGGSSPDFSNPNQATKAINLRGVKGQVTMKIRPGTYNVSSRIHFERFASEDTVSFRPSDSSNSPALFHSSSSSFDNFIFKVIDSHAVAFVNLDFAATGTGIFGRILWFDGEDTDKIGITNCSFDGLVGDISDKSTLVYGYEDGDGQDDFTIQNSSFTEGSAGIFLQGGAAGPSNGGGTKILNNSFDDQSVYAINLDHVSFEISLNSITGLIDDVTGLQIEGGGGSSSVERNTIQLQRPGTLGVQLNSGTVLLANNFINANENGIKVDESGRGRLIHNTIRAKGNPVHIVNAPLGVDLINNIFIRDNPGPALVVDDASDIGESDFNIFDHEGAQIVSWDGTGYLALSGYQTASGLDSNSKAMSPLFVNEANGEFHLTSTSIGDPLLGGSYQLDITTDYDGELRSVAVPYIGADESTLPLGFSVKLTALLDGPYDAASPGSMLADLNDLDLLPFDQSYSGLPWSYAGDESFDLFFINNNTDIIDWVLVEMYSGDPLSPPMILESRSSALIRDDGQLVLPTNGINSTEDISFVLTPASYYIGITHRNHLQIMSSAAIDFTSGSATYDFSQSLASAFSQGGTAMRDRGDGYFTMWAGDGDVSSDVTAFDFLNVWLLENGGAPGYSPADFNMDGSATAFDFLNAWLPANGQASQVP